MGRRLRAGKDCIFRFRILFGMGAGIITQHPLCRFQGAGCEIIPRPPPNGGHDPRRSHAPLAREVADIFIPLTRNENSAMTVGRRRRGLGNDRGGR